DFLRSLPDPDIRVIRSINAAVTWFDAVKLEGIKFDWNSDHTDKVVTQSAGSTIWARFYDLENSKPLFSDRDGQAYTDVSQISLERHTGYSWYGTWCANNIKLGTIAEPAESKGMHIYVGYSDKQNNYSTVQEAVNAAAALAPSSEDSRVNIHIAPGVYREQVYVNTPYISFINDDPTKEVKITWYYGIGYTYYSLGTNGYYDAASAQSKSAKGEATRWGSAVALKSGADYFRAEYITFENSFNRYVTDEEIADGVEVSGSQSITFQRVKGADVTSKTATERAAAIAVEGDNSEFYKCTFLGSQDTLFTGGTASYFRECVIEGNTDYIFGGGTMIFQECELKFAGYSDKAVGGYITAAKDSGKYLFYGCNVTGTSGMQVGSGYFGRPWGPAADVAFANTKLQYESIITSAGWTSMSGNDPANANYKEYNTTVNGSPVNTSGRISGTVRSSGDGLDVDTYLNGWVPYYYDLTHPDPVLQTVQGSCFTVTPDNNAYPSLWKIGSDLQVGDLVYTDRDMVYTALPQELIGAEAVRTPCDGKKVSGDLASFTASEDVTLYILLDTRVENLPDWMSGLVKLTETAANDQSVEYYVYKKSVSAGESVTLGSNGQSAYCVNYAAAVVKETAAAGDVNGDGAFNVADVVLIQKWLLAEPGAELKNWSAADLDGDGQLTVLDLCLMRQKLADIG
ncbi:MAG: pectate lyase, partial [Ruminococcus sp.]|nr:pectate lyase [Ruminococcus sp.]